MRGLNTVAICTQSSRMAPFAMHLYLRVLMFSLTLLLAALNFQLYISIKQEVLNIDHYWSISNAELPIRLRPAALKIVPTEHYHILNDTQWHTTFSPQPGYTFGFVRLGTEVTPFEPAIFHQMHCLNVLRQSLVSDDWSDVSEHGPRLWHVNHCLNMIRQAILCNSDTTLEPSYIYGTHKGRNQSAASGMDVWHICRDWNQVDEFVKENYKQTRNISV
ncbi:hypothetical protein F5890DRAFT_1468237 [Lentinula detonsa]|uniref:Uncharacterized protein n=1 Tax=Lentinula detonsa TaxID=2804962 RepID=A0AA38PRL1_9AGAR|nr:hypothetical protein F5890DRAFT_1468237 [Lentinula detonsa]